MTVSPLSNPALLRLVKPHCPAFSISSREICDTVAEETAPTLLESDDETREETEIGFKPELEAVFDRVREAQEKEEETILNRAEKDQLARDLREYKKRFWLALVA